MQRRSRPEQSDHRQPNQAANISHQPRASPDSTSLASRIELPTMTVVPRLKSPHKKGKSALTEKWSTKEKARGGGPQFFPKVGFQIVRGRSRSGRGK